MCPSEKYISLPVRIPACDADSLNSTRVARNREPECGKILVRDAHLSLPRIDRLVSESKHSGHFRVALEQMPEVLTRLRSGPIEAWDTSSSESNIAPFAHLACNDRVDERFADAHEYVSALKIFCMRPE